MGVQQYLQLVLAALLVRALAAPPAQLPLLEELPQLSRPPNSPLSTQKKRPLHGRFLQITDFHPDPFYEVYSSTAKDDACHRGHGSAGVYGAETSDCDSPISLVNKTIEWVGKEFRDEIDFIIWTGDSARHDNDDDIPRSEQQVLDLNRMMVRKITEVFGKHNGDEEDEDPNNDFVVPIVPNLGNNDILPHNIMRPGPNSWTRSYSRVWRQFIPEEQRHQFEQGGWFFVEVIPNRLAVFSLNTLYFFASNAAADGCAKPSEPGYQQMEWLRIQLQFMRDRGMKAMLIGHVPPARQESKTTWEETCWQKYTLWLRQYRDVVISNHYGHFNYDHMILQDFEDLRKGTKKGKMPDYDVAGVKDVSGDDDLHVAVSSSYFIELREDWSEFPEPPESLLRLDQDIDDIATTCPVGSWWCWLLHSVPELFKKSKKPKKDKEAEKYFEKLGGRYAERYAASFVSASVVPNLFPTVRLFEYNVSGLEQDFHTPLPPPPPEALPSPNDEETTFKDKKYKFDLPEPPSKSSPPGPAYSPQTLSLLGYKQYLANLTYINNDFLSDDDVADDNDEVDPLKWKEGKHKGKKPHDKDYKPKPHKFKFELHYDTKEDDVYKLKDLTMPNLIDLARRIGDYVPMDDFEAAESVAPQDVEAEKKKKKKDKKKKKKDKKRKKEEQREQNRHWFTFVSRAYVGTLDEDRLRDEFGS